MSLYITLPCKPVVKQFIINRYGTPIKFPHNDWLRSILINNLVRHNSAHDNKLTLNQYTQTVNLPIIFREYKEYGNQLTKTGIMHINQAVQDIIEEVLYNYIHLHHQQGGQLLYKTIQQFRIVYAFPEHTYTTDAINKFWQRTSKKRLAFSINNAPETVLLPQNQLQKTA